MRRAILTSLIALSVGCGPRTAKVASITLTRFETIQGPPGGGGLDGLTLISPALRGGYRIAYQAGPSEGPPLVIAPDDQIIDTLVHKGSGPGEVEVVSRVLRGAGDSVYLIDIERVSIFSPDLHFVRSWPSTVYSASSAAVLPSGDLALASAIVGDPEVVTVLAPQDGAHRWGVAAKPDTSTRLRQIRNLAVAPDGSLWTLLMAGRLEFEHFDQAGRRLGGITVAADWYPPYDRMAPPSGSEPPSASTIGFWVDSLGRAWVVGLAADPRWALATGKDQPGEGGGTDFVPDHIEEVYDGVLDVFDLNTGRSLASLRNDAPLGFPIEPWVIQRIRTDADGRQQIDLYRVAEGDPSD